MKIYPELPEEEQKKLEEALGKTPTVGRDENWHALTDVSLNESIEERYEKIFAFVETDRKNLEAFKTEIDKKDAERLALDVTKDENIEKMNKMYEEIKKMEKKLTSWEESHSKMTDKLLDVKSKMAGIKEN